MSRQQRTMGVCPLVAAALSMAAALSWAEPARADCSPRNVLADASSSAGVVVARVQSIDASGEARARVEVAIKGPPARSALVLRGGRGEDDDIYTRGGRYLLFLDASGAAIGPCATRSMAPAALRQGHDDERTLVSTLRRWLAATTDDARRQVLVDAALGRSELLGTAAAEHLAASPTITAGLSEAQQTRIVGALRTQRGLRVYGLAWVLARLHRFDAIAPLADIVATPGVSLNSRPIHEAIEVLTNHHDDAYRYGEDISGEVARGIADRWRALARAPRDPAWITRGFAERVTTAPARLDDARLLAALVRSDRADRLSRAVALTYCEPLARVASSDISHIRSPGTSAREWAERAAACER